MTFTKEGDKITNANKMIYCVFVRCTKYKANHLTCFVRVSFSMAAVPQKRGQVSVCFSVTGETCYSGVASAKTVLCFLIESAVITIFLGGYTVWQQQLNRAKPAYELSGWERFKKDVVRDKWLYLLILPGMLFMLIFRYIPIFGNVIAFMDFNPYNMWNSTWVGFDQFIKLFNKPAFMQTFYNTLYISILKMVCGFPIPIILALMMNEMRNMKFKKVAQTLLYLPHFISWVVMAGLIMNFLDPSTGLVTALLKSITGKDLQVLTDKALFVPMLIITDIYKTMGWGTIIYFAALSGVDPQLYEAAEIDGARKWKQMINITLPAITPTIVIMLILNCNNIVNAGFDQIFMLYSALVYDVADIIDTYVYRIGIQKADYSFSTAAGMFKSIIALVMILIVNFVAKKTGNEGIW